MTHQTDNWLCDTTKICTWSQYSSLAVVRCLSEKANLRKNGMSLAPPVRLEPDCLAQRGVHGWA